MLKDLLGKNVKVGVILSQSFLAVRKGILTDVTNEFIKLDDNVLIATKYISIIEIIK